MNFFIGRSFDRRWCQPIGGGWRRDNLAVSCDLVVTDWRAGECLAVEANSVRPNEPVAFDGVSVGAVRKVLTKWHERTLPWRG
jgi:hypothetical protein